MDTGLVAVASFRLRGDVGLEITEPRLPEFRTGSALLVLPGLCAMGFAEGPYDKQP